MRRVICNETQWLGAFAESKAARAWRTLLRVAPGTPMGPRAEWSAFDIFKTATTADPPKTFNASSRTANYGPRGSSIRKNIIGHRMRSVFVRLGCGKRFGSAGAARALLEEPSREHGGRVFFDPLVEQRGNLLAEIGGVAQPRKLKALKGVS